MFYNVQYELKNNNNLLTYIHFNSFWYKNLTRDPYKIEELKQIFKDFQKQQKIEKVSSLLHYVELMQMVANSLR